ncbi:hypothetical protein JL720_16141 [Aureococcus anophagefferens]|nr:hypothetical protein JL720_16141 [Aureococcus anophagefferens]
MEGRTFRQRWDDALDLMYDVRSIVLALRYHGVPFLVLALMVASYSWSVEAWTSVVNENRASLGVSIRGFRWVRGMAGDGLQVCKGATKSLTTLYELHTDLAYEYVGGTRVALDSRRTTTTRDDLALEQQLDEPWDDAAAAPTPAAAPRRPCDVDVSVDAFEDLAKLSKRTISGPSPTSPLEVLPARRTAWRAATALLFGAPPNALAFFCDWFEATAATTHSVVNATTVAFGNASSAYAGAFSRVGAVGDNGAGSPAMAWVDGLAPATLEAFLDDVLETADATRYVCGVALSAFSELRVETERRAIRTYARVRDGASDALAELCKMALRASGVTRYGETQLARAKSYAALTKDVIDFSFDAVSTAVWALFDKAGDLATAMFSSKTVASLLDDVDLSVEMTCDLSDGYRGDARGVFWAALVAWMVQFYLWYYMSFRFYLSTHHALRKVLDDGETTLLDLIMDDEDDDERRKVDKAIDRLPKRVGDRVKRSKVLEKRELRKRTAATAVRGDVERVVVAFPLELVVALMREIAQRLDDVFGPVVDRFDDDAMDT